MSRLFKDIVQDVRSRVFLPAVCIGFILGLLIIILEISFAAMIFSGEMSHLATRGAGLTLTGGFLICLSVVLISTFKSTISLPQDAPAAIFSGGATLIAAQVLASSTGDLFMTIVAALILSSILTAAFFFTIARFRLVHFFRYTPYPVIGGFLAGTGWILTTGSLEVMLGANLNFMEPGLLFAPDTMVLWLPGTVLAIVLFCVLRRYSHFTILPAALVLGIVFFYLVLFYLNISIDQARETGLLFEAFASKGLWPVFSWAEISEVNWQALASQLPVLLTIPFIALMGLLLNMSGVELASGRDIDMNKELMANSLGNFLCGMGGSHPGYSSLSLSMLGYKTGAYSRIVGLTAAVVVGMTLVWGGMLISIFPKAVLGGFLMLLGFFFLWDWVVETRKKMVLSDYLIVLFILIIVAWLGFFQGVLLGILLSVILFVVRFSQVPVLKSSTSNIHVQSSRNRPLPHRKILLEQGSRVRIFQLSGYLFFGSVNSMVQKIDHAVDQQKFSGHIYVVIDFSETTGVDVSSVSTFVRLLNRLVHQNAVVIFTGASSLFLYQLKQHLGLMESQEHFLSYNNFDQGLMWAEDRIIDEQLRLFEAEEDRNSQSRLFDQVADEMLSKLERLERAESIFSKLDDYSKDIHLEKDETLLAPGQEVNGVYWLQQGRVVEMYPDESREVIRNEFGPGDVINIKGLWGSVKVSGFYKAGSACRLQYFSTDKISALEENDPGMAAGFYSILLRAAVKE
ncbi:MAG: STAS domain-containing protein [Desulfonatronovibrio sp. MSAO_Bac4]|nr:MAG: STAS domain-containing protein [Desulfonatronovibrio sp. MSAO_Bac4]